MLTSSPPDVVPVGDEVLPGYRVEALLSRGGRVDTYDVTSLERDCRAVVKVVRPDRLGDEHVRAAVRTEGELLTTLSHPHLVRGYEVVAAPRPAVVVETLPGATLAALIDDRLGVADTALLGRQLVSVLGYLHRNGWVHLDVKPDNVVVQEGRAVLIDLGWPAGPARSSAAWAPTATRRPSRTPAASSPATDVWGLGATLAECVTGRAPGRSPDLSGVPARLRPLVGDCLQVDPTVRPGLDVLRDRLDALLEEPEQRRWSRLRRWPCGDQDDDDADDHDHEAQADQHGADDPADPAGVGRAAAADLTAAGVDLGDHAVAHHPGDRRDELAHHQPQDPEDQHQERLLVVRRGVAAHRRLAVLVGRVVPVGRLAGRWRGWLRHGAHPDMQKPPPAGRLTGAPECGSGDHLVILVTRPAPTVRPPSRIAKRSPSSIAMGWISSTAISVLSPGMTISVPSGRVTTPVTSVVRK